MTKGQKFSALGLVLMGASAVCAFVLPKEKKKVFAAGHLALISSQLGTPNTQFTCRTGFQSNVTKCDFTVTDNRLSFTSAVNAKSSAAGVSSHAGPLSNTGLQDDGNGTLVTA